MKKDNLFVENYNKENRINVKENLDIYDECSFSYLDILKEKEVEILSKVVKDCKCVESVNFNTYYEMCDKCKGVGKLTINENEVICNHCLGKKRVIKNVCPLCSGEGKIIKEGKVTVSLNKSLKEGDVVTLKGCGKESNGVKGDLYIKVKIYDLNHFNIKGKDVYDRRIIHFSKEDISKNNSKRIETIKGYVNVKSSGEEVNEVVKLNNEGLDGGDFYICLNNELSEIKGKDIYKNIIVNKDMLGFYLSKKEINSDIRCLTTHYFKKVNDMDYIYVELEDVNNFKIIKLKEKGLEGKHGGVNGDLYLRVYFEHEFKAIADKLYSFPMKLTKYEISEGKKIIEYSKSKIILNFDKNLTEEKDVEVKEYGFMIDKNSFDAAIFRVNPFPYNVYKVSVRANKNDKTIYLKDYKRYFYEEVKVFDEGLKVILSKKKDSVVVDSEGNKVIVRTIQ